MGRSRFLPTCHEHSFNAGMVPLRLTGKMAVELALLVTLALIVAYKIV